MRSARRTAVASAGALALVASLAACGGPRGMSTAGGSDAGGGDGATLTVFAAASLTDVFRGINSAFERDHPGVSVAMTTGGSQDLVAQIAQGAPADVLATADTATMDAALGEGLLVGEPRPFASNELAIAVQPGNPRAITGLDDLAHPGMTVVRCAVEVPCGTVAAEVLGEAGVRLVPASEENSVTDVLGKVTSGNADAGLVYATDVRRSKGRAEAVAIPAAADHRARYPIAVVDGSEHADLARAYADAMLAPAAQSELRGAGFGPP